MPDKTSCQKHSDFIHPASQPLPKSGLDSVHKRTPEHPHAVQNVAGSDKVEMEAAPSQLNKHSVHPPCLLKAQSIQGISEQETD